MTQCHLIGVCYFHTHWVYIAQGGPCKASTIMCVIWATHLCLPHVYIYTFAQCLQYSYRCMFDADFLSLLDCFNIIQQCLRSHPRMRSLTGSGLLYWYISLPSAVPSLSCISSSCHSFYWSFPLPGSAQNIPLRSGTLRQWVPHIRPIWPQIPPTPLWKAF